MDIHPRGARSDTGRSKSNLGDREERKLLREPEHSLQLLIAHISWVATPKGVAFFIILLHFCYTICITPIINTTMNTKTLYIGGGIIVLSILVSLTLFISARDFSKQGSYIEVKGLSEKIVKADNAIWSLGFETKSNDIDSHYADIDRNIKAVKAFLTEKGFDESEINVAPVNIYQDTYKDAAFRYNSSSQISVYTKKVDLAKTASNSTLLLVKKGVALNQNYISFEISDLNSIKPEMLAEAIKNARDTASQFASSSGSTVGEVARGNQGVFEITNKDPGSPEYKKVRLVSTLRFLIQ